MSDNNDIIKGERYCPRCGLVLMEKIPNDGRQIKHVVRFFCVCGYYIDIPVKELLQTGWRFEND